MEGRRASSSAAEATGAVVMDVRHEVHEGHEAFTTTNALEWTRIRRGLMSGWVGFAVVWAPKRPERVWGNADDAWAVCGAGVAA
jgi:hypothetical protein